jgi:hypothetical protein
MSSVLSVILETPWKIDTTSDTTGFYDTITTQTKLPTEPYLLITYYTISNSTLRLNDSYYSTFTNSVPTTSTEDSDISLATTLVINYGGSYQPDTVNISGYFTITLYPFLNGQNIVIPGGATTIGLENVETNLYYTPNYIQNTDYTLKNYTVTVLNQSFPASDTNCTLYFRLDPPASETPTSLIQ